MNVDAKFHNQMLSSGIQQNICQLYFITGHGVPQEFKVALTFKTHTVYFVILLNHKKESL
jgi:hypothetical protein